ncbi:MAG: Guanylate kinase [bacterium ADurb.Bin212]|nr:MAG: Guanylate kinase [bacterium ADurb.Bin212]
MKKIDNQKVIFVISGPAGSGKGTVCAVLKHREDFDCCVSCTTRPKRPTETDQLDYHFVSESDFSKIIDEGGFIEWECVHGNRYGTRKSDLLKSLNSDKNILLEIDVNGAENIKKLFRNVVTIFIALPNAQEGEKRLKDRKTEDSESIRIRKSRYELENNKSKDFDYIIVNHNIEEAQRRLIDIVSKHIK